MRLLLAAAALLALVPSRARAHGVALEVERRGAEVAVRAVHHDGRPLADARYEVLAPPSSRGRASSGRTDRRGGLVFVPDAPGTWSVRIAEADGHGAAVEVEVPPASLAGAAAEPRAAPAPGAPAAPRGAPGPLRILAGVAAIGAVFAALLALQRWRRAAERR